MKKTSGKNKKSIFTDLDKDIKRENQVYVNDEIIEAVIDAKKKSLDSKSDNTQKKDDAPILSTIRSKLSTDDKKKNYVDTQLAKPNSDKEQAEGEAHPDDLDIYDSLFSETTIVSTQIYTYDIDKSLGEDNFSSDCVYRVGQDLSEIGSIFSITKKNLEKTINVSKSHSHTDIDWYNDLAGLGFSYAAVCGTTVRGIIICEPQYWNNTLYIRHLMVEKDHRKNGIGKMLIEECIHRAQVEGFRAITLEVTSTNGAAIDFYRHIHFNIVGLNVGLYSNSDILKEDVGIFMHRIII